MASLSKSSAIPETTKPGYCGSWFSSGRPVASPDAQRCAIIRRLFDVASALHVNFYEDWGTSEAVAEALDDVEHFVHMLDPPHDVAASVPTPANHDRKEASWITTYQSSPKRADH